MEEGLDVDDLFGDPTSLDLGLSSPPPLKGLAQRLDELRQLGCCRKLAWSRLGCIAWISPDGLRVGIRYLLCRPTDGNWVLSDDSLLPLGDVHGHHVLVHLSWNEAGSDLAIVDSSGRVSIYSVSTSLNNLVAQRQATLDPDDEGGQIVGMMWLNGKRNVHFFHQAAKLGGRWGYSSIRRRPIGPFHPVGKTGLLIVTKSGLIRLLYQNPDSQWAEITAELRHIAHSDRLLTHAALVATLDGILVVTYSACQKICLYRVNITWNPPQWDANQPKQATATNPFPTPTFHLLHVQTEASSGVFPANRASSESSEELSPISSSLYSLTHLDIIPGQPDSSGGGVATWILAVYSSPVHVTSVNGSHHGSACVIVRWQLEKTVQTPHPKFDELTPMGHQIPAKQKNELRRLDDFYSDRSVISIDQVEQGYVIAVTYDDSSISLYDPRTMIGFNKTDDLNTLTSLAQAGFHYPLDASGLQISFSPNCCMAVVLDGESQMRLRHVENSFGDEDGLYDDSRFSAAMAAMALTFCRACGSDLNTDDLLMIVLQQLSPDAQIVFISEVYRALPIHCHFTAEQDKIILYHPYIPRCLSVQAALGFKDRYSQRTLPSTLAWAILHLRHASNLLTYFIQYSRPVKDVIEPQDPDIVQMILGNTKWVLSFMQYALDEVFDVADDFEAVLSDQEAFAQKVKATTSLSLILHLCSLARGFLRTLCRALRVVHANYPTTTYQLSSEAHTYYREIYQAIETSPVPVRVYEQFLLDIDTVVKNTYEGAGFGDAERPVPEKELLLNARPQNVLVTAAATFLRETVPALKPQVNRLTIHLADYSWLGLSNDQRTDLYRRTREVDVLKKIPLRVVPSSIGNLNEANGGATRRRIQHGQARRQCVRCCEISGDVAPRRSLPWFRMVARLGLLRSCMCGGMWTLGLGPNSTPNNETPVQSSAQEAIADANS